MSVLLFLNELSCATDTPRRNVDLAMLELVELLRTIRRWRRDVALVTQVPLKSIELARGYHTPQWIAADAANRDRWRMILAIQNHAPFRAVTPEDTQTDVEYRHGNRRAEGLGAAHLLDGLALSLSIDAVWENAWVATDRSVLIEDDSGNLAVRDEHVEVRHASHCDHATQHKSWVQEAGREDLASGVTIWKNRDRFFPHLTFLPRVEGDLRRLRQDWVRPVVGRLFNLERAVADWDTDRDGIPKWQTKVTGEFETRQDQYCEFVDIDGVVRVFEWHARFTPGAGRLHFRLVPEEGTVRVAYIGLKQGL